MGGRGVAARLVCLLLLGAAPVAAPAATTELVSLSSAREVGDLDSYGCALSGDGRYVAFMSDSLNLVPEAAGYDRIFLRDRVHGTQQLVDRDVGEGGAASGPSVSEDGRFVAFAFQVAAGWDIYVRDMVTGVRECVSVDSLGQPGNGYSYGPSSISADGRYVAFYSEATNLVADDTNGAEDVFLRDRLTGTTELVSVSTGGEQGNNHSVVWSSALSADGRYVAFISAATNWVPGAAEGVGHAYVRDRLTGTTECVDDPNSGDVTELTISADGRYVAFTSTSSVLVPNDTNGARDVFVRDMQTGQTERVSVSGGGEQADDESRYPSVGGDGRYVVFCSPAANLVSQDTALWWDVFIRDREGRKTERVSVSSDGSQGDNHSGKWPYGPSISADGRFVAYQSTATNLVPGDGNAHADIFVRDRNGLFDVAPGYWAYRHILACFHAGIVSGYADGSYQSLAEVTRSQMAVYIARSLAGCDAAVPPGPDSPSFPDVPLSHWAYKHVEYVRLRYVVQGYDDGSYRPEDPVDRGQMAVYVARSVSDPTGDEGLIWYTPPPTPTFADVSETFWARKHVEFCHEQGVVQGYSDGMYHPEYTVTRDQMAVYIARAFGLT
ncbi:MAG: S-layer homology domain-containing protein [Armatimonadota bacterium]